MHAHFAPNHKSEPMNFQKLVRFTVFLHCCFALILPSNIFSRLSKKGLLSAKLSLKDELQGLWPNAFQSQKLQNDLLLYPKQLLTSDTLPVLGLGKSLNLSELLSLADTSARAPRKVKPVFVFNTTKEYDFSSMKEDELIKLLSQNAPFSLPDVLLVDYFLGVPQKSASTKSPPLNLTSEYFQGILGVASSQLPVFKELQTDLPILTLLFKETNPLIEKSSTSGLPQTPKEFFDCLAQSFFNNVGLLDFLQSVFCTINPSSAETGYCLTLLNSDNMLIFPATGKKLAKLEDNEHEPENEAEDTLLVVFESQVLQQAHDKLANASERLGINGTLFADEPRSLFKEIDLKIDDRPVIIHDLIDEIELIDSRFDDHSDDEDTSYGNAFQRLDSNRFYSEPEYAPEKRSLRVEENDKGRSPSAFRKLLPVSLFKEKHLSSLPRLSAYQQVVYNFGMLNLKRRDDCVPITWYNIFHHSIFGTVNFCQ